MIGTSVEITHVGRLIRKPSIVVNEDDFDVVPQFAKLAYPFASKIVAPNSCRLGRWDNKRIGYTGYHELAYIGKKYFVPSKQVAEKYLKMNLPSVFIRLSALGAYHDKGKEGMNIDKIESILNLFKNWNIILNSEKNFQGIKYTRIDPKDVHHVMSYCDIYVGDSQTMAAEAALLGVIAVRYNDFVGKIGYLDELEVKYKLGYGFKTAEYNEMMSFLLEAKNNIDELKKLHQDRLNNAIADFDDTNEVIINSINKYANDKEA